MRSIKLICVVHGVAKVIADYSFYHSSQSDVKRAVFAYDSKAWDMRSELRGSIGHESIVHSYRICIGKEGLDVA